MRAVALIRIPASSFRKSTQMDSSGREIPLTPDGELRLNQWDIRELQKAKGAIRAALDVLMAQLGLRPKDLQTRYPDRLFRRRNRSRRCIGPWDDPACCDGGRRNNRQRSRFWRGSIPDR